MSSSSVGVPTVNSELTTSDEPLERNLPSVPRSVSLSHRVLEEAEGALYTVRYRGSFSLVSPGCSGWLPVIEFGCSDGGTLETDSLVSFLSHEITCGGSESSWRKCQFAQAATITRTTEGLFFVPIFSCSGSYESQSVAEIYVENDGPLRCETPGARIFTSLEYLHDDEFHQGDGTVCRKGRDAETASGVMGCAETASCKGWRCDLDEVWARQSTPIPAGAFFAVPVTTTPTLAPIVQPTHTDESTTIYSPMTKIPTQYPTAHQSVVTTIPSSAPLSASSDPNLLPRSFRESYAVIISLLVAIMVIMCAIVLVITLTCWKRRKQQRKTNITNIDSFDESSRAESTDPQHIATRVEQLQRQLNEPTSQRYGIDTIEESSSFHERRPRNRYLV